MDVKIKIKSTVTDLALADKYTATLKDGYFRSDNGERLPYEMMKEECDEVIEYTVRGEYREENGKAYITYKEPEEIGLDCVTTLIFDTKNKETVTMTRSGELSAAFCFDPVNKRQRCSYETPYMPVEFTVNTRKVGNTVTEKGGAILLDYCIEIRGVNTERNKLFIKVTPI
ncbi:MAG: DUF1934 domain-containing protein [Clostridia bacterium]|nr:DUF1934 domain-containing protein [Clostridia bacterium]